MCPSQARQRAPDAEGSREPREQSGESRAEVLASAAKGGFVSFRSFEAADRHSQQDASIEREGEMLSSASLRFVRSMEVAVPSEATSRGSEQRPRGAESLGAARSGAERRAPGCRMRALQMRRATGATAVRRASSKSNKEQCALMTKSSGNSKTQNESRRIVSPGMRIGA